MSVIDLECIKSEYCIACGCHNVPAGQLLRLGQCNGKLFEVALFFHLPPAVGSHQIKQARLFLFKVTQEVCCSCPENMENEYSAYPLLEFFGSGCCFDTPQYDKNLHVEFRDRACISDTEIDITKLVKAWVSEQIDNKGILLQGCKGDLLTYASIRHKDMGMRPFVRISYQENHSLVSVPCSVVIS